MEKKASHMPDIITWVRATDASKIIPGSAK